jgi:hypothetical protein
VPTIRPPAFSTMATAPESSSQNPVEACTACSRANSVSGSDIETVK